MTLDYTDNSSPVIDREYSPSPQTGRAVLPPSFKKIKEAYDEDIEKQDWGNEGGADPGRFDSISGRYGLAEDNTIIAMVDDAFEYLNDESYDEAVQTITAAMEHAIECQTQVKNLVRYAIDRLSTLGHPADPPHPGALTLVKKRNWTCFTKVESVLV